MKKRIISVVLILVMAFSLAVCVSAANADITVDGFEAKKGETVTVNIRLEKEIENAVNGSFSLKFNPEVVQIAKVNGRYAIEGGNVFENFTMLCAGNNTEGYANYGGTATSGEALEAGVIYTVEFKVLEEADPEFSFSVESLSLDSETAEFESVADELTVSIGNITLPDGTVIPDKDEPSEDEPIEDEPVEDEPVEDEPVEDEETEDEPSEDEPVEDEETEDKPSEDKEDTDKEDGKNENNIFTGDTFLLIPVMLVIAISAVCAFLVYKKKHNC